MPADGVALSLNGPCTFCWQLIGHATELFPLEEEAIATHLRKAADHRRATEERDELSRRLMQAVI